MILFLLRLGHLDIAILLIDHGANASAKDDSNRTPLIYAAIYGKKLIHFCIGMKIILIFFTYRTFGCCEILDRERSRS